jgi:hypothetical protein
MSGTTMTVVSVTAGKFVVGMKITGVNSTDGIINGTTITAAGSGTGYAGTYTVDRSSGTISSAVGVTGVKESFIIRTPGVKQYLYASDVHSINAVFDFEGQVINDANYATVLANPSANITSRYTLDTGQKDSYYDFGAIILKQGQPPPKGPLLIRYNRFRSTGTGFFDVDSYTRLGKQSDGGNGLDYGYIPQYVSENGVNYRLQDYLDFRPVRKDAVNAFTSKNFVFDVEEASSGPKISDPEQTVLLDYSYYLPRVDRVVLNRVGPKIEIVQGIPSETPSAPDEPEGTMTLYTISHPAYLTEPAASLIKFYKNRRYTMKDIGTLEKRIENLEVYQTLTIAELSVLNKDDRTTKDPLGVSRPKNGIFVDTFVDKTGSAITNQDYLAAIDPLDNLCRGSYYLKSTKLINDIAFYGILSFFVPQIRFYMFFISLAFVIAAMVLVLLSSILWTCLVITIVIYSIFIALLGNILALFYLHFYVIIGFFYVPFTHYPQLFKIVKSHGNILTLLFCIIVVLAGVKVLHPTSVGVIGGILGLLVLYKIITLLNIEFIQWAPSRDWSRLFILSSIPF